MISATKILFPPSLDGLVTQTVEHWWSLLYDGRINYMLKRKRREFIKVLLTPQTVPDTFYFFLTDDEGWGDSWRFCGRNIGSSPEWFLCGTGRPVCGGHHPAACWKQWPCWWLSSLQLHGFGTGGWGADSQTHLIWQDNVFLNHLRGATEHPPPPSPPHSKKKQPNYKTVIATLFQLSQNFAKYWSSFAHQGLTER